MMIRRTFFLRSPFPFPLLSSFSKKYPILLSPSSPSSSSSPLLPPSVTLFQRRTFCSSESGGQENKTASWDEKKEKVDQFTKLFEKANEYVSKKDPNEAEKFVDQALAISKQNDMEEYTEMALRFKGFVAEMKKDPQEALKFHAEALELSLKLGDKKAQAMNITNVASFLFSGGKKEEAVNMQAAAIELWRDVDEKGESLLLGLSNLGDYYWGCKDTEKAMRAKADCVKEALKNGKHIHASSALSDLSLMYGDIKAFADAMRASEDSIRLIKTAIECSPEGTPKDVEMDLKSAQARALGTKGTILMALDKEEWGGEKERERKPEEGHQPLTDLSNLTTKQGEAIQVPQGRAAEEAVELFRQSSQSAEEASNPTELFKAMGGEAQALWRIGERQDSFETAQRQFGLAETSLSDESFILFRLSSSLATTAAFLSSEESLVSQYFEKALSFSSLLPPPFPDEAVVSVATSISHAYSSASNEERAAHYKKIADEKDKEKEKEREKQG